MTRSLLVVFVVGLAACQLKAPEPPLSSLADTQVPAGFNFRATRSLRLTLHPASGLDLTTPAGLRLLSPAGDVLYRGGVAANGSRELSLAVPTADQQLTVELTLSTGAVHTLAVPLASDDIDVALQ